MTPYERGFLLLCSHLGQPSRAPLSPAQLRRLSVRVRQHSPIHDPREMTPADLRALGYSQHDADHILSLLEDTPLLERYLSKVRQHSPIHDPREMTPADLRALGYSQHDADHILSLLEDTPLLERYLSNADDMGYGVLTRVSPGYPGLLRMRLGTDAPPCLWYSGDPDILAQPGIGVVGSRDLRPRNAAFARSAGVQIHRQGFTLISGGARGADRTAQDACLDTGGKVVCVLPDRLADHPQNPNILYLCEDSFDFPFQTPRALSRNRVIHALGQCTLVAQCTLGQGGTWDGSTQNLRHSWSLPFQTPRALSRNRVIHALGQCTLVAQCTLGQGGTWDGSTQNLRHSWSPLCCFDDGSDAAKAIHALGQCTLVAQCTLGQGGTWDGSTQNLRHSWSPLCCFDDGSDAAKALQDRGARLIRTEDLSDLKDLSTPEPSFF